MFSYFKKLYIRIVIFNLQNILIMKKSKIKLVLKKETLKTLNASEARHIRGASGSMMCEPPADTKAPGQCPTNSSLNLCNIE